MSTSTLILFVGLLVGLSTAPSRSLESAHLFEGRPADAAYLGCASYADRVLLPQFDESGRLVAVMRSSNEAVKLLQPDTQGPIGLPIEIPQELKKAGKWHVLAVSKGWLLGWDHGEFGGALWYLDGDDARATMIVAQPVMALFRTPAGNTFAFLGPTLARVGTLARVDPVDGSWRLTNLGAAPGSEMLISRPGPGGQYLWSDGLWRITPDGQIETWLDYTPSVLQGFALAFDDEYVYVGLRLALLRVRLMDHSDTWFYACNPARMRKVAVPARLVFNGKTTTFTRTVCRCE